MSNKNKTHFIFIFQVSFSQKNVITDIYFFLKTLLSPYLLSVLSTFLKTLPPSILGHPLSIWILKTHHNFGNFELSILITLYYRSLVCIYPTPFFIGRIDRRRAMLKIYHWFNDPGNVKHFMASIWNHFLYFLYWYKITSGSQFVEK